MAPKVAPVAILVFAALAPAATAQTADAPAEATDATPDVEAVAVIDTAIPPTPQGFTVQDSTATGSRGSGPPDGSVNCGGHFAETCRVCGADVGEVWCNGDCTWVFGSCQRISPTVGYLQFLEKCLSMWYVGISPFLLLSVIMCIYAGVYKQKVVDQYHGYIKDAKDAEAKDSDSEGSDEDGAEKGRIGLFHVFRALPDTLAWSCFCAPVLAAKNYEVAGVSRYWPSCVAIYLTLFSPLPCLAALIRAVLSSKLQKKLTGRKPKFGVEFLTGLFCFPCAVGRESLEVDAEEYAEVRCAFKFTQNSPPQTIVEELIEEARSCMPTYDGAKERAAAAWGATRDSTAAAWGATRDSTTAAWDATKDNTVAAWDSTKAKASRTCGPGEQADDVANNGSSWWGTQAAKE